MIKKFIFRTVFFLSPIILLHVFTFFLYNNKNGDLLRIGYIINAYPQYRNAFKKEFSKGIKFVKLSEKPKQHKYTFLTIGDSFSEQGPYGYQNYLSENYKVLHIDRFLSGNQINTLFKLIKGDFFDKYKFDYVVLQCVERSVVLLGTSVDTSQKINCSQLDLLIDKHNVEKAEKVNSPAYKFPSNHIFKVAFNAVKYFGNTDCLFNDSVYRAILLKPGLFSVNTSNLFFFHDDIKRLRFNNQKSKVVTLNNNLNLLSEALKKKGVRLIVIVSPDKYDFYYPYIKNKNQYTAPLFFNFFDELKKSYSYINGGDLLKKSDGTPIQDAYFYDDTHWSPLASQQIAKKISVISTP
jgi:hypothetical protein